MNLNPDNIENYNYDSFIPDNFMPLMRFSESPPLGSISPDFSLWSLDQEETKLSELWANHEYLVVEFGSFT
ncbi:MAG: hypothetical protein HON98_08390 [Chloroflexi bacterium]|nr:hypothetical protein [Chloroflexota bacterium]MBT3669962.1 hypothetical protein [Chloroflexota bacterium]MBT4002242.1 hypothetical protein [Chloroflexota bacterium]MBT4304864.1 hypothetical protein [Chloroflexota bacterium]MBT4534635.1 hypothetical protein [Chloroflexota bacterium]